MFTATAVSRSVSAFVSRNSRTTTTFRRGISKSSTARMAASDGQAEVVLVGCGAPNRGTFAWMDARRVATAVWSVNPAFTRTHLTECFFLFITLLSQVWDGTTPYRCSIKSKCVPLRCVRCSDLLKSLGGARLENPSFLRCRMRHEIK